MEAGGGKNSLPWTGSVSDVSRTCLGNVSDVSRKCLGIVTGGVKSRPSADTPLSDCEKRPRLRPSSSASRGGAGGRLAASDDSYETRRPDYER